ncbi:hypothetical protein A1507_08335 [Methylomonas koyamae]|uniref:Uncharacterized protein n=1 Tax=Methylomonas koyamae TaxID=702114 RepID=A0A177NNF5_9GAMM|nr:hypothetical protein A1507_08335 [Methylomonas koyamae]
MDVFYIMETLREAILKSGLGPTAEFLSFARPKERNQRKGRPTYRLDPALLAFGEGFRKGLPAPPKTRGIPAAPLRAVLAKHCDARGGIRGLTSCLRHLSATRFLRFSLVPTRCVGMPIYRAAVCIGPQRGHVLRYHAARGNEKKVILPYLLLVRVVFLPFCCAEHRRTWSESPARGAARMPRVFRRGWEAPSENPGQVLRSAGIKRHGVSFLLGTFLWTNKEKYLGCRAETRLKTNPSRQRHLFACERG